MHLVRPHHHRYPHHRSHPTWIPAHTSLLLALVGLLLLVGRSTGAGIPQPEPFFEDLAHMSNEFDLDDNHLRPVSLSDLQGYSHGFEPDQMDWQARQFSNEAQHGYAAVAVPQMGGHSYATTSHGWQPNNAAPSGWDDWWDPSEIGATPAQRASKSGKRPEGSARGRRTALPQPISHPTGAASRYASSIPPFQEPAWQAAHPNIHTSTAAENKKFFADVQRSYETLVSLIIPEHGPTARHHEYQSEIVFLPEWQQSETQGLVNRGVFIGGYTYVKASELERTFVLQKFLDDAGSAVYGPDHLTASHPDFNPGALPGFYLVDKHRPWARWQDRLPNDNLDEGIAATTNLRSAALATTSRGPTSSYSINGYIVLFRHLPGYTKSHVYQVTAVPTKKENAGALFSYSLGYLITNVGTTETKNYRERYRPIHK